MLVNPGIAALLGLLQNDLVVIGSVARKDKVPSDLDIWIHCDGFIRGESRYDIYRKIIKDSKLRFHSIYPMSWSFSADDHPPTQVELIGTPNIDAPFAKVRKLARLENFGFIQLPVAPPEYAGTSTKRSNVHSK